MDIGSLIGYMLAAIFALFNLIALWFLTRIFTQLDNLTRSDMELTKEVAALRVELNRDHYSKKEVNEIIHALRGDLKELIEVIRAQDK
jgi:uncharacterized membrane protein